MNTFTEENYLKAIYHLSIQSESVSTNQIAPARRARASRPGGQRRGRRSRAERRPPAQARLKARFSIGHERFEVKYFDLKQSPLSERGRRAAPGVPRRRRVGPRAADSSGPAQTALGAGTNSAMAPATAAGLSTGTHVMASGTVTSVACGKSDASRRAWDTGKNWHCSPQMLAG